MGVALIWSPLWNGKMWDFLPYLECRPGVGDHIGISHLPLRPVVLYLCNNSVWGAWAMLNSIASGSP